MLLRSIKYLHQRYQVLLLALLWLGKMWLGWASYIAAWRDIDPPPGHTSRMHCTPIWKQQQDDRATDKVRIFISKMPIFLPNPMFYHLLESSHRDDSNKCSNVGFCQEITQVELIEVNFTHLIWGSDWGLSRYNHPMFCYNNLYRAPDRVHPINFNRIYLCYLLTKSYV